MRSFLRRKLYVQPEWEYVEGRTNLNAGDGDGLADQVHDDLPGRQGTLSPVKADER